MARVFIPAQWRDVTSGIAEVTLPGRTLREVVTQLLELYPPLRTRLLSGESIAPGIAISIDGATTTQGLLARVQTDSEIHFLPAIGGG